jgi:hypothetical protein
MPAAPGLAVGAGDGVAGSVVEVGTVVGTGEGVP